MDAVAETLFEYLRNVIYDPEHASLDLTKLPESFQDFGKGLSYFANCVMETKSLALALSKGDLSGKVPSPDNEIASPLKSLHASLRHLTWQTQQVANGDYQQRVKFMGDFAQAFNMMAQQLEERKKKNTREKSKLQQYIDLLLLNTPNIILVLDTQGKAVLASETYKQCSGMLSEEALQGKTFRELFSPIASEEFLQCLESLFREVTAGGQMATTEQNLDFGQGEGERSYFIDMASMHCENGKAMGAVVVFHDMTDIILARRDAERACEIAEQSTRAKSEFLAMMSHEMRTPMNAIIGMTSIGKNAQDMEKKDYAFQKIQDASTHLLGVINDILDMSKIEADKFELSDSAFSFEAMLDHVVNLIQYQVSEKKQNFVVDVDQGIPPHVVADEQHLKQVIMNLLSNAVKFTPVEGKVTLTVKKLDEADGFCTIHFRVTDTGIGISDEQKECLFQPFVQADGSISRKFGGTGLGLSISKRIIEKMGGSIQVESEIDKGASFFFDVKLEISPDTVCNPASETQVSDNLFKGKHMLIAEDVDVNREIIAALLEDTGVAITFAVNGEEAVDKYISDAQAYDLILMDIQMPQMDGYEATKRIRASGLPGAGSIPILAMTANVFREDIERCLSAGMNGHLGKPVDVNEVIEKCSQWIR
ncbi:MAG: ATP-binding protein [Clostridiales bacterium]|nr:ATP-binding protein [Clostridiales bacterium]